MLVRNGLDSREVASDQTWREPNTVLAVGRITPPKNYSVLIEASHLMGIGGPRVTVIGGDDLSDELQRLKSLLRERPQANVRFTGVQHRDTVFKALDRQALYVNCSIYEGMSNAVLEAVQHGTPLILSDIEANRDLDLDDRFYFDPRDPATLAEKIKHALVNPVDYIVPPEKFENWDRVIGRILNLTGMAA